MVLGVDYSWDGCSLSPQIKPEVYQFPKMIKSEDISIPEDKQITIQKHKKARQHDSLKSSHLYNWIQRHRNDWSAWQRIQVLTNTKANILLE